MDCPKTYTEYKAYKKKVDEWEKKLKHEEQEERRKLKEKERKELVDTAFKNIRESLPKSGEIRDSFSVEGESFYFWYQGVKTTGFISIDPTVFYRYLPLQTLRGVYCRVPSWRWGSVYSPEEIIGIAQKNIDSELDSIWYRLKRLFRPRAKK